MSTISFAITACNEHVELERLLDQINSFIKPEDEIVLQLDLTATEEVSQVAIKYNVNTKYEYHRIYYPLNSDFSAFKNNLKNHCTKDWIFFIDADEYLSEYLKDNIHEVLEANKDIVDVINVPRINTVEGLTQEHINKWGWRVDENGYVNYPDYQTRICANKQQIQWFNKVHERLEGWKTITAFPPSGYDLLHPKTIDKQEKQNNFYDTI
jgi:predicted glycosyltransferase involved in capsule biosynthesis